MSKDQSVKNFEQNLQDLESLVSALESGNLSLEESLDCFEQGIKKTQACHKALDAAEQKVNVLVEKSGVTELEPFIADSED